MRTNIENTQSLLHEYELSAKKTLGQNFLISQNVVDSIIESANISNEDIVFEIGPGLGALSEEICKKAKKVYLFEIDSNFENLLKNRLNKFNNYELIINDFLKININKFIKDNNINEKIILISNLPYYITSKLLLAIFKEQKHFKSVVTMMQKDVGDKILYSKDNKDKNTLSILINLYSNKKEIMIVSRENFLPQPHVDSSVLKFDILEEPRYKIVDGKTLIRKLNELFLLRRKVITKSLNNLIKDKDRTNDLLEKCQISPLTRVEQLSEEKIIEICNYID